MNQQWCQPSTAHTSYVGMAWVYSDCFAHIIWGLTTDSVTGLNQVGDKQQAVTLQTFSLTVLYSFKIHSKIYRDKSLKVGVFGPELSAHCLCASICADMDVILPLAAGEDSHLLSERRYSHPESITKLRKGLKGSQISVLSSICLSSINNTHIKAVVQEQIRKVEFFAWCNSLHLLTFFPFRLSVVLRCLAFRMICNVNYIIVLSHILTSNRMIDYRIWAVYRWGSIIIWIITLPHKNSMAMECDIFLSLCISMKSGWYIKGYHLGNIFS